MDDGRISVRVYAGVSKPKTRYFPDRNEAIAFAESKMGRKGMVLDTTLMTPEQLEAHKAREARAEAIMKVAEAKGE
ncbi:hypothetical protein ACELLULO517_21995 [Acidisoma cellulosilytica]|uniref:Uncharacterized protein n=1 Tax=Acidisoma cellulosilyticum TaxID=2802395 RepID=A0A963Z6F4_9PROT|nr:hypothetical protein [Acidisoma cellulosilyticum]MCB8882935.1 hypothetical protein [Acidisoma cellulosilyticum]